MKVAKKTLAIAMAGLLGMNVVSAQEVKPFDKKWHDNVVVKARQISDGPMANPISIMGDSGIDPASIKTIEVMLLGVDRSDGTLKVELVLTLRDKQGSGRYFAGGEGVPNEMTGALVFTTLPSSDNEGFASLRQKVKGRFKVDAWCIRVIRDGQIVGVAGSPLSFEKQIAAGYTYIQR